MHNLSHSMLVYIASLWLDDSLCRADLLILLGLSQCVFQGTLAIHARMMKGSILIPCETVDGLCMIWSTPDHMDMCRQTAVFDSAWLCIQSTT